MWAGSSWASRGRWFSAPRGGPRRRTGSREGPRRDRPRLEPIRARGDQLRDEHALVLLSARHRDARCERKREVLDRFQLFDARGRDRGAASGPSCRSPRKAATPDPVRPQRYHPHGARRGNGPVWRVLAFFALANIAFQCAYVFYNALLSDVSDSSNA